MDVATGKVHGKVTEEKKRADFQVFMDEIVDSEFLVFAL
jgi:hypothetical protein